VIHEFVHRYEIDQSRPRFAAAARDAAVRGLGLAALWWLVVISVGFLIHGPLNDLQQESVVNEWFVEQRTATLDTVTWYASRLGDTFVVIGIALVAMSVLWWRTRQWWLAVVPGLAAGLQSLVFLCTTLLVGRERPEVEMLDDAPPTSSYPSGHTGASTALYVTFALLAQRIRRPWLRTLVTVLVLAVPLAIGTARLYRGMHHLSDVLMGVVNGVVAAVIAWHYLRRSSSDDVASAGAASSRDVTSDEASARLTGAAGAAYPSATPTSAAAPSVSGTTASGASASSAPPGSAPPPA
jgi:membrane-associated phospholipid phosphatase